MSTRSSPTLIGAFVVGAVALIAVAVALFGGTELFQETRRYVTYFDRSVKGLRVGSNVLFKGVRIGYVTDIKVVGDIDTLQFGIPVVFEVVPEAVRLVQGERDLGSLASRSQIDLGRLIDAGLRAQLNSESFVTGQLVIELDIAPEQPAVFRGINPDYPEIPSIPSDIQQALEDLRRFVRQVQSSVDVEGVMQNLQSLVAGLERIVNSDEVARTVAGIEQFVNSEDTQSLTADLRLAVGELRAAIDDARSLIDNADGELSGLAERIDPALRGLEEAIAEGGRVLEGLNRQIGAESEVNYELVSTLNEIQQAARALRGLLDYLDRHPEAILRGKQ